MRLALIIVISICCTLLTPFLGKSFIGVQEIFNFTSQNAQIFWNLRLPNTLLAFLTGSTLSLAGYLFQSLFRNALATPYTLGVASGASFGTVLAMAIGIEINSVIISGVTLFSFLGALLAIGIVYTFAGVKKNFDPYKVLLAGVSLGMLFSSFILLIQYLNLSTGLSQMIHWLMGNVSTVGFDSHWRILPFCLLLLICSLIYSQELDFVRFNTDLAISRGVNIQQVKKLFFLLASLSVASIVAEVGPIGFVGLLVPHATMMLLGHKGKRIIIGCVVIGGSFLSLCEFVARSFTEGVIPLGLVTTLMGTPLFILLLIRKKVTQ